MKSDSRLKELNEAISEGNSDQVSEKIENLRKEQPFSGVINILVELYDKSKDPQIKKSVSDFMNDLKDQSVVKEVMYEIKKTNITETKGMLLSSCWQSGLNYKDYVVDFAEIFCQSDYVTAIECLTIIGEALHELNNNQRDEIKRTLNNNTIAFIYEKESLLKELLSMLD